MMNLNLGMLNPQQREATTHIDGPLLILAGAGSGKTRVITTRIAYLITRGIEPKSILAVSFTNKAATEMQERVAQLTGDKLAQQTYLSTFHSLGADILRQDIDALGFKKPFTILDQGDQQSVIKDAFKELKLDPKVVDPRRILSLISKAKMGFCEPKELPELKHDPLMPYAQKIYGFYTGALKGLNAVDFDDLICLPVVLFKEHEKVRQKYARRFQYVMVDEYQDTNMTQLLFLRELVKDHMNLCVVGDDDQSIYGFRGAVAENILEFEKQFEGVKVVKLEQNYRSTNNILRAANEVIANNSVRKEKALWSSKGDGTKLRYVECEDEREEAEFVAAEIERYKLKYDLRYRDCAILYRVNPQSRLFEEALRTYRIPYTVVGSTEFFDRKEVKDFVAYLKACVNHNDEVSIRRVVNVPPRGIGPTLLERISDFAHEEDISFHLALCKIADDPSHVHGIGYAVSENIADFIDILDTFNEKFEEAEDDPSIRMAEISREVLKRTNLIDHIRSVEKNPKIARRRIDNVDEILSSLSQYQDAGGDSLKSYLTRITLDRSDPGEDEAEKEGVRMMTLHSSKGLEFPVCFLVGMEEGYLPHGRSLDDRQGLAEERRLCYVGITRAKEHLTLTSAAMRKRYGQEEDREPSRFLEEIPEETIEWQRAESSVSLAEKREEQNQKYLSALKSAIFDD
ncbi:ATP-dependent DNA helicase Rep [Persicimonas caeni]|uniref:DNA 3'-5' helicase n=1 Tax=Persicimonas caeni TaxID=2292766 RepID=A0A4Y6PNC5_PERCE|nr:UvrD-helicase domain-containing protein [Persicimonas caeni]QDG49719.1 ATP-dependent DNA helicase Rep [Persicimonas caeni]QED30940.1 AAA family ATPase [Persicimonas caeni]